MITVSIINLFSVRKNPDRGSENHPEQLSIMLVSIATTLGAFVLTVIGAGRSLAGLKLVAARVSVAGARRRSVRQNAAGNCVVPITNPLVSELEHLEGIAPSMRLQSQVPVLDACWRIIGGCVQSLQLLETASLCTTASRNLEVQACKE